MHSDGAVLLFVIVSLAIYFVPAIVAFSRQHHQKAAILVLNLFLGWSGLGWIVALVWSFTAVQKPSAPAAQG